jgi:hypothetical protein
LVKLSNVSINIRGDDTRNEILLKLAECVRILALAAQEDKRNIAGVYIQGDTHNHPVQPRVADEDYED